MDAAARTLRLAGKGRCAGCAWFGGQAPVASGVLEFPSDELAFEVAGGFPNQQPKTFNEKRSE
jgi:hypothetical protein